MKCIAIVFVIFVSCVVGSNAQVVDGEYYKKGKDFEYSLTLREDSTFVLILKFQDGRPQCKGRWILIDSQTIQLKCDELTDITEALTNGYMSKREQLVRIIGKRKLKLDEIILDKR